MYNLSLQHCISQEHGNSVFCFLSRCIMHSSLPDNISAFLVGQDHMHFYWLFPHLQILHLPFLAYLQACIRLIFFFAKMKVLTSSSNQLSIQQMETSPQIPNLISEMLTGLYFLNIQIQRPCFNWYLKLVKALLSRVLKVNSECFVSVGFSRR